MVDLMKKTALVENAIERLYSAVKNEDKNSSFSLKHGNLNFLISEDLDDTRNQVKKILDESIEDAEKILELIPVEMGNTRQYFTKAIGFLNNNKRVDNFSPEKLLEVAIQMSRLNSVEASCLTALGAIYGHIKDLDVDDEVVVGEVEELQSVIENSYIPPIRRSGFMGMIKDFFDFDALSKDEFVEDVKKVKVWFIKEEGEEILKMATEESAESEKISSYTDDLTGALEDEREDEKIQLLGDIYTYADPEDRSRGFVPTSGKAEEFDKVLKNLAKSPTKKARKEFSAVINDYLGKEVFESSDKEANFIKDWFDFLRKEG